MANDDTHKIKADVEISLFEKETDPKIKLIPKKWLKK